MDLHAPHHPLSSWKEFWIHLGTITIGLLIAISLEQSVEFLHRMHQRHQLQRGMRRETEKNMALVPADLSELKQAIAWHAGCMRAALAAVPSAGKVTFTQAGPPWFNADPAKRRSYQSPTMTVWATARESSTVSLLPSEQAGMFSRQATTLADLQEHGDRALQDEGKLIAMEIAFDPTAPAVYPRRLVVPTALLADYLRAQSDAMVDLQFTSSRLDKFSRYGRAVLSGVRTEDEMIDFADRQTGEADAMDVK